jgi:NitT/TauT family transport system substrate-binding protein
MARSTACCRMGLLGAAALAMLSLSGVAAWSETARQLRIGVQFGLGYLPLYVAKDAGLFDQRIREQGLDPVPVEFSHLAGGPQVNDGLLSESLEIGSGGYTAMMVYCDKTRSAGDSQLLGVTALSAVPYELFTVDPELKSLKDLQGGKDKVGVPSVKVSVPAIYLQMAAEQLLGPGHHTELDQYTVSLAQPDGVISLLSGGTSVSSYLFSPPFTQQVEGKPNIRKVWSSNELFESPATALVTWTTAKFHRENPKLVAAFIAAIRDAIALIERDPKRATAIYMQAEKTKLPPEFIAGVIADKKNLRFSLAPEQSGKIADFLFRTGSLKAKVPDWKTLFFPELRDEQGS